MTSIWLIVEHLSDGGKNIHRISVSNLLPSVKEALKTGDVDLTVLNLEKGKPFPQLDAATRNCDIRTELALKRRLMKNTAYLKSLSIDPLTPVIILEMIEIYQPNEEDMGLP